MTKQARLKPQKKSKPNYSLIDNGLELGATFQHFKGSIYRIVSFATDTENQNTLIIYKNVNSEELWARPISIFLSSVEREDYSGPRFIKLLF